MSCTTPMPSTRWSDESSGSGGAAAGSGTGAGHGDGDCWALGSKTGSGLGGRASIVRGDIERERSCVMLATGVMDRKSRWDAVGSSKRDGFLAVSILSHRVEKKWHITRSIKFCAALRRHSRLHSPASKSVKPLTRIDPLPVCKTKA